MSASIEELRAEVKLKGLKPSPSWQPPVLKDFAHEDVIMAFDQTLSNCGYAHLEVVKSAQYGIPEEQRRGLPPGGVSFVRVLRKGTLHPKTSWTGFLGTWDKAMDLERQLEERFAGLNFSGHAVIEHPLVGPGHRPESALLAGSVIYSWLAGNVYSCSARHVSSVLVGNPHHDKKEIAAAVARYIPSSAGYPWSEHSRDAAAMALVWLYDRKQLAAVKHPC